MKKCGRCHREFDKELFICPHCGAIYDVPQTVSASYRRKNRPLRVLIIAITIVAWLAFICLLIGRIFNGGHTKKPTVPTKTTTSPTIPTTTVNEIYSFTFYFVDENGNPVSGVQAKLARVGYSEAPADVVSDADGRIFFEYERADDILSYVLQIVSVPEGHHDDAIGYYMPEVGKDSMTVTITTIEPIRFTAKVVDENGTPVPGAGLRVQSESDGFVFDFVTGENGIAQFELPDFIEISDYYLSVIALPKGYYSENRYSLSDGISEVAIVIRKLHDQIIRVVDESGMPVAGAVLGFDNGYYLDDITSATDENGICVFSVRVDADCRVQLLSLPDGFCGDYISFVDVNPGVETVMTVMNVQNTQLADGWDFYTVAVLDRDGTPFANQLVLVRFVENNAGVVKYGYTNENGQITFCCSTNAAVFVSCYAYIPEIGDTQVSTQFGEDSRYVELVLSNIDVPDDMSL